jgi:AraC family transcriptional regulator
MGLPLHLFVLERRLQIAQHLLGATSQPLREIAASCGFASQQHTPANVTEALSAAAKLSRDRR